MDLNLAFGQSVDFHFPKDSECNFVMRGHFNSDTSLDVIQSDDKRVRANCNCYTITDCFQLFLVAWMNSVISDFDIVVYDPKERYIFYTVYVYPYQCPSLITTIHQYRGQDGL